MILYKHQQELIDNPPNKKFGCWHETGTGKSFIALGLAEKYKQSSLIICPKSVVQNWEKEWIKFTKRNLVNITIMSKETFRRDWDKLPHYNHLIIDECHAFSQKSMMTFSLIGGKKGRKVFKGYLQKHNVEYVTALSATPFNGKNYESIYNLASILGRKWGKQKFMEHFYRHPEGKERYYIKSLFAWVAKDDEKTREDAIVLLKSLGVTKKLCECRDIKESVFKTEFFEQTAEQKKAIKELDLVLPIQRFTAIHQILNGSLKGHEFDITKYFNCEKLKRIKELISEHKKLVIYHKYTADISSILVEKGDKKYFCINGQTKNVQEVCDAANACDDCVVLIQQQKAEGYNLGTFDLGVYYNLGFSLKDYEQSKGRIKRINNADEVKVYLFLLIKDTIDSSVYESMMKKQEFNVELYATENDI